MMLCQQRHMGFTVAFTVIHPLFISVYTYMRTTHEYCSFEDTFILSLRAIKFFRLSKLPYVVAFNITGRSKYKNDFSDSLVVVKYHSGLITYSPRHPCKFIDKCTDGHKVLALQCASTKKYMMRRIFRIHFLVSSFFNGVEEN